MPPKRLATRSRSGLGTGWFSPHLGLLQPSAVQQLLSIIQAAQKGTTHPVQLGSPAVSARSPVPAVTTVTGLPEVQAGLYLQQSSREGTWRGWSILQAAPCQTRRVAQRAALGSSTETGCAFLFLPGQNCLCNMSASRSARL